MMEQIKKRFTGVLICEGGESIKALAEKNKANLGGTNLRGANLSRADLSWANLGGTNLREANLGGTNLGGTDLREANLGGTNLWGADLSGADLRGADLREADLREANLVGTNLWGANLREADLRGADLRRAYLWEANLNGANGMVKIIGVEVGNIYWKRFDAGLCNNAYQYHVGLNKLQDGEIFASDERIICSYPGFHFASRSWCAVNFIDRPLEAKIRIPEGAKINEPWATDGKASADRIEILQVFEVSTGKDVTEEYR